MTKPKAPPHLSPAAKRWFREIATDFDITDRAGLLLLTQAAECWDRATAYCPETESKQVKRLRDDSSSAFRRVAGAV